MNYPLILLIILLSLGMQNASAQYIIPSTEFHMIDVQLLSTQQSIFNTPSSPLKQLSAGILPEDIKCKETLVLVIRTNGNPVCVKQDTAERRGWNISTSQTFELLPNTTKNVTLYVNSELVDCIGLVPQKCMLVREDVNLGWGFFYQDIVGFDYQSGYLYKLDLLVTEIKDPPQDASSLHYELIGILERTDVKYTSKEDSTHDHLEVTTLPLPLDSFTTSHTKYVNVFGVNIIATAQTSNDKILHAATILKQYLDNDKDGYPDNQIILDSMINQNSLLIMSANESDEEHSGILENPILSNYCVQNLYGVETNPFESFDASLEEVWHIISHCGYSVAYPEIFGYSSDSLLAQYMDNARGGHYTSIPSEYPLDAWYSYEDYTCDYSCQVDEYFYWVLTSILGAQEHRLDEINYEWRLNTADKVRNTDPDAYNLLTDPVYNFPSILPNP